MKLSHVTRPAALWMVITAVAAAGTFAWTARARVSQDPVAAPAAAEKWLEFDIAEESAGFTGLIVGYFEPGAKTPAVAFEIARARVQTPKPGVARIPLVVGALQPGRTYEIRLRTVVGKTRSAWSEPSGTFIAPGSVPAERAVGVAMLPEDANRQSGAVRQRVAASAARSELTKDQALADRIRVAFPAVDPVADCDGFRNVRDCITALYVASNLKVPFGEVKKVTAVVQNRNMQRAIAKLKPDVDARAEARKAAAQSRKLTRPSARQKK